MKVFSFIYNALSACTETHVYLTDFVLLIMLYIVAVHQYEQSKVNGLHVKAADHSEYTRTSLVTHISKYLFKYI